MALITRTYTFTDGTTAYGSQVDSEVSNITNLINSLDAGTTTWDIVKVVNGSSVPLIADNSSGSNDVVNFKVNGVTKVNVTGTGNLNLASTKVTGLGAATTNGDAVRYEQVLTGQIVGTTTNDSASSGNIGEYLESVVNSGSAVAVANTDTWVNVTSITLTAGDWDLQGHIGLILGTLNTPTVTRIGLSTSSGNTTTDHVTGDNQLNDGGFAASATQKTLAITRWRKSVTGSTVVYIKSSVVATGGSGTVYGKITARRVR